MKFNIFCRINWNTLHWTRPSGDAVRLKGGRSFAAENGFGFEEWLFNFNWEDDDGYKYGFLQPIHKQYRKYNNETGSVILYSKPEDWWFVAKIDNCHVLSEKEKEEAYDFHEKKGWLEEMKEHLELLNLDGRLVKQNREYLFNIRFKKEDVTFLDPYILVPADHKIRRTPRYQTLLGTFDFNSLAAKTKLLDYPAWFKSITNESRKRVSN